MTKDGSYRFQVEQEQHRRRRRGPDSGWICCFQMPPVEKEALFSFTMVTLLFLFMAIVYTKMDLSAQSTTIAAW